MGANICRVFGNFNQASKEIFNFWTKTKQARKKPEDIQFEVVKGLDIQKGNLGDCGVFMCMWLEKLISGMPLTKEKDAERAALDFRMRMAKIYLGSL